MKLHGRAVGRMLIMELDNGRMNEWMSDGWRDGWSLVR